MLLKLNAMSPFYCMSLFDLKKIIAVINESLQNYLIFLKVSCNDSLVLRTDCDSKRFNAD